MDNVHDFSKAKPADLGKCRNPYNKRGHLRPYIPKLRWPKRAEWPCYDTLVRVVRAYSFKQLKIIEAASEQNNSLLK